MAEATGGTGAASRLRITAAIRRLGGRLLVIAVLLVGVGPARTGAQTEGSQAPDPSSTTTTTAGSSTTTTGTGATTAPPPSTTAATTTETSSGDASSTTVGPTADELQAELERVEAAEAAKAREVDTANAALSDVTEALRVLQERVDAQSARVEYANQRLEAAEEAVVSTEQEVADAERELANLQSRLSDQAIRTFMGDDADQAIIVAVDDPNEALRRQAMLAQATQTDLDLIGELRAAQEDLVVSRAEAVEAVAAADRFRRSAEEQLATLEEDRRAQGAASAAAEQRLDHLLSEQAALAALGEEAASELSGAQELADQLAQSPPPPPPPPPPSQSSQPAGVVTDADIAHAGNGIYVHVSIVDDIRQLLADASAAGVELAGGGYRSPDGQIAIRRSNCGTSTYAIYEMPASQCRPPTARPGRSMHEQGKAIDFTHNGKLIRSRSGGGWNWLSANAARYGLINLPSEPWHWSVNGR